MEQVVVNHPNVLTDPGLAVTFESFMDGTLKFVIRGYLASLDVRPQTFTNTLVRLALGRLRLFLQTLISQ
jgi:small-conductance mechanosensitive channel